MSGDVSKAKEVRLFASSTDRETLVATIFMQPSFYVGIANAFLMVMTQYFPHEFLPASQLQKRFSGVQYIRFTALPFCIACSFNFMAASGCAKPQPLIGHFIGFASSVALGFGFIAARKASWFYPALGSFYIMFGMFHHYRRMKLESGNASIYYLGDATEIWRAWREKKRVDKERRRQLLLAKSKAA